MNDMNEQLLVVLNCFSLHEYDIIVRNDMIAKFRAIICDVCNIL